MKRWIHVFGRTGSMPGIDALRAQLASSGSRVVLAPHVTELRGKIEATVDGAPTMFHVLWADHDEQTRADFRELADANRGDKETYEAVTTAQVDYRFLYDPSDARQTAAAQAVAQFAAEGAKGWLVDTSRNVTTRYAPKGRVPHAFELLGADGDEIRLVRSPESGYSIALAGTPRLDPAPPGRVRWDIAIALDEIRAFNGFRMDRAKPSDDPQRIAFAGATEWRDARAEDKTASVTGLSITPRDVVAGAQVIYSRRGVDRPTMEAVTVMLRPFDGGLWRLSHATWFANADVANLEWAHLRASFLDQHAWDGAPRDALPQLWPPSELARPSARLSLTPAARQQAADMSDRVGHLATEQVLAIADRIRVFVQDHYAPRVPAPELLIDTLRDDLRELGPRQAVDVLLSTLGACQTRHDLRGWALQATIALGTRTEVRKPRT